MGPTAVIGGGSTPAVAARAAEDRVDAGDELTGREGLGHVVVGAKLEAEHPIDLVVAGAQHEDRDVPPGGAGRLGPGPERPADVESVERAGQADVDDDQFRVLASDELEPRFPVAGLEHAEAVAAEVHGDEVRDVVIVLDHHQGLLVVSHRVQPATGGRRWAASVRKV